MVEEHRERTENRGNGGKDTEKILEDNDECLDRERGDQLEKDEEIKRKKRYGERRLDKEKIY